MNSGLFTLPLASLDGPLSLPPGRGYSTPVAGTAAFLAGDENAALRVLAAAVTTHPPPYNPIVLYGPQGVGKSTVAHALAARHRDASGNANGIVATAPDLARAVAHAADTADIDELRSQYHNCDWLLIDDVDRLAKRPAAQQFLLNAVEALLRRGVLVVATLRHLPHATSSLLPRLASRLSGGLVLELASPGYEARCAIARQTAAQVNLRLTEQEIHQIARSRGGLADRVLTAGKVRAAVYKRATAPAPTTAERDSSSHDETENCKAIGHTASAIVARHYGVPAGDLRRPTRRKTVAAARALAMYLVRTLTGASYAAIGKYFGGRDHTTVLYACRKLTAAIENDDSLRRSVDELALQIAAAAET